MSENPTDEVHEHDADTLTEVGDFDRKTEGYIVILPLPSEARKTITDIQSQIASKLPGGSLWLPRDEQLHITFAHVVSPDAEYSDVRSEIFKDISDDVVSSLHSVADLLQGTDVTLNEIHASKSAIYLVGHDNGAVQQARQEFIQGFALPESSRRPPNIIHTTIVRFKEEFPFEQVDQLVAQIDPDVVFKIGDLELIKEHSMYTQSHSVLETA